ncbi:MAG: type I glyceraldehyde-3-phosphate dehydrogenase [Myxococcales bacterium]|nr:type I glyceraldehyde-3-phosphate dehydrogenase [Myxococcales bacterium]
MAVRIGINGFGRIGRCVLRAWQMDPNRLSVEFAAINDLTDTPTLAHLLKFDSVHGRYSGQVRTDGNAIVVDGHRIVVTAEKDLGKLNWKDHGVSVVLECTGAFTEAAKARAHIDHGGAQKVLISAPAKGPDITLAMGINQDAYDAGKHHVISNASCTTNCLAPVAKVLLEGFGIENGMMTTIHSYTNDQRILDLPHKDLRRARAAALSMIPTTTGAAKALSEVIPALKGKLDGYAMRVPTPNVSVVDLTVRLSKKATVDEVNAAFRAASQDPRFLGVLAVSDEPTVSCDYNGDTHSATVDLSSTQIVGDMVKVLAWYDNEMGYATRLYELAKFVSGHKAAH